MWTVRHAPKDSEGLCVGQYDVPVRIKAPQALSMVIKEAPIKPEVIFSSDISRCADLASLLAQHWGIPHRIDLRLREMSMGEWEGKRYDDLLHDPDWMTWCENWKVESTPRGESLEDLNARVRDWYEEHSACGRALLISHAGVVRTLHHIAGMLWEDAIRLHIPHLEWREVRLP